MVLFWILQNKGYRGDKFVGEKKKKKKEGFKGFRLFFIPPVCTDDKFLVRLRLNYDYKFFYNFFRFELNDRWFSYNCKVSTFLGNDSHKFTGLLPKIWNNFHKMKNKVTWRAWVLLLGKKNCFWIIGTVISTIFRL